MLHLYQIVGRGMPIESMMAHVWSFRDGKAARMDMYSDPKDALKAVGLV